MPSWGKRSEVMRTFSGRESDREKVFAEARALEGKPLDRDGGPGGHVQTFRLFKMKIRHAFVGTGR